MTDRYQPGLRGVLAMIALVVASSAGCADGELESIEPALRGIPGTDAVVRATVVDDSVEVRGHDTAGMYVHVDAVLWLVGDAVIAGHITTIPAPETGTDLLVMPRGPRPASGADVILLLSYLSLPNNSEYDNLRGVLWFVVLATDSSGVPVKGTDETTVEALGSALMASGETDRVAALIDLVAESAAILRARNLGAPKPVTPRADRVWAAVIGSPPAGADDLLDEWLSIDPSERPLAVTGDSIMAGSADALNVEWVRIEAQVVYDASFVKEYPAALLVFRDIGVLGVFHLDPRLQYDDPMSAEGSVAATPVFGWAPRGIGFTVVGLASDGMTRTELLEVPPSEADFFVIDLRDVPMSHAFTESEYMSVVDKMRPGS